MLFVIICHDGPDAKELRPRLRSAHLEYLETFDQRGKLALAGPLTDAAGSLIVIDLTDEKAARRFADRDPYNEGGVFAEVEIHPFKQVFPAPEGSP